MAGLQKALAALAGMTAGTVMVLAALYVFPFHHTARTQHALPAFVAHAPDHETYRLLLSDDFVSVATSPTPAVFPNRPAGTPPLIEPNVRMGLALITRIRDADNRVVGFATELEAAHEDSSFLRGRLMTHTTWTVVLPGRGVLFLYQTEDNWTLVTRYLLPGLLKGRPWHGRWLHLNTLGPSPQGYGEVIAGTGAFAGRKGRFVEVAELRAFQADTVFEGVMDLLVARNHTEVK
ncbi:hypothetical protein [Sphingosinicella microcystinivorans]|uniref:hypothetical protein n=1 Tax=Sphingosinicella microcystinivorans TaxID=335406 RepID=UPI0022F391D8|nr:hypothetical protein [Sphingosinicella microcystinivorans]WBX85200.1 hypothetical protein PE061_04530 [Sphingosinicella microcystinivorans]